MSTYKRVHKSSPKKKSSIPLSRSLVVRKEYWPVVVVTALVLFAFVQTVVQAASLRYDSPESLLSTKVLGDDDQEKSQEEETKNIEDQKKEEEKNAEEQQKEAAKKRDEERKESSKNTSQSEFRVSNSGTSTKSNIKKESGKVETELRTSDGTRLKTKVEDDGTTKIEVRESGLKVTYKIVNGKVEKIVEKEDGTEVELNDEEVDELEDKVNDDLQEDGIEISTESGKPTFSKNRVAARTNFPLSIDPVTNQLFVTTPKGTKAVAVLPDEAIKAMLANNVLTTIDSDSENDATDAATLETTLDLQVIDGKPVYEVNGTKEYKLFAFVPVTAPVKALVSAETGLLVGTQKSFITNLIDLLSP